MMKDYIHLYMLEGDESGRLGQSQEQRLFLAGPAVLCQVGTKVFSARDAPHSVTMWYVEFHTRPVQHDSTIRYPLYRLFDLHRREYVQ